MIETFINYLKHNRGLSEKTLSSYTESLQAFARYISATHSGMRWSTIEKTHIDGWVEEMVMLKYEPSTIKRHISALRTFYKSCMAMGTMKTNPARYVSTPKLGDHLPKVIETTAIRRALDDECATAQAKAAIAIIFETGMRVGELLAMRREDIDCANMAIKVRGKGNKERTVYYSTLTQQYGRKWKIDAISERELRRQVFNALRPHSKAKQLSPHAIRHTFASELINKGMSMEAIRKLLGHEHITTTEIYAQMSNETARALYRQYQPTA